jgi:hypothetical protein
MIHPEDVLERFQNVDYVEAIQLAKLNKQTKDTSTGFLMPWITECWPPRICVGEQNDVLEVLTTDVARTDRGVKVSQNIHSLASDVSISLGLPSLRVSQKTTWSLFKSDPYEMEYE